MNDHRSSEEGSTLILTIFYGALALAIVLAAAAITSMYMEKKRLFAVADAAALAGSEAITVDVDASSGRPSVKLAPGDVRDAVDEFIAASPSDTHEGVRIERATTLDGVSATVTVSEFWAPPVVTLFAPKSFRIEATGVARTVFDPGG